jgi:type IV pilus assembly protein PilB
MMDKANNIGQLLIRYGKITQDDLEDGLKKQKVFGLRLGETLIRLGKVTMADIEWILSKQLDIPFVIVEDMRPDPTLISRFQRDLLIKNRILPLYETEEEIAIATDDPLNKEIFGSLEKLSGKKIRLSSGNGEEIEKILQQCFTKEGVPTLTVVISNLIKKLEATSFYRLDFVLTGYSCDIRIFGCGILKDMLTLNNSFTKEQVFGAMNSLNVPFLYNDRSNEALVWLSLYPVTRRDDAPLFPAISGVFGLSLPKDITFTDAQVNGLPDVISSPEPVFGYTFVSLNGGGASYEKTLFTIDSAPPTFSDWYVNLTVPRKCDACFGAGCERCVGLGYTFPDRLNGTYSSGEIRKRIAEARNA